MANPLSQKKLEVADFRSVGEIVESAIDLEKQTNGKWLLCDGRVLNKSDYPEFASKLGTPNILTITSRTLAGAQTIQALAASDTHFVASRIASATTQLQTSTDGITWDDRVGSASAIAINAIVWTGTRWVITSATAATGQVWHNTDPTTAFTQGTGLGAYRHNYVNGLAYSSTLNRLVTSNSDNNDVETSDDHGVTWTLRALSGNFLHQIVWSGSAFVALTGARSVARSDDGITWVEPVIPYILNATNSDTNSLIATNGTGTIVAILSDANINFAANAAFLVSTDHGLTWRVMYPPPMTGNVAAATIRNITCANGIFFADYGTTHTPSLGSTDGINWRVLDETSSSSTAYTRWAYKSGVYFALRSDASTTAASAAEATSSFRAPLTRRAKYTSVGISGNLGWNEYVKVKS